MDLTTRAQLLGEIRLHTNKAIGCAAKGLYAECDAELRAAADANDQLKTADVGAGREAVGI